MMRSTVIVDIATVVVDIAIQSPLTNTLRANLIGSRQLEEEPIAQTAILNGERARRDSWPCTHHGRASVADHLTLHHTCPTNRDTTFITLQPYIPFPWLNWPSIKVSSSLHPYISCLRLSGHT